MEAMTLPTITPAQAKALLDEGARLIDIRDADEHRRQAIPGAANMPLSALEPVTGHPAQIISGLLILTGVILSLTVARGFVLLSGFVGAGLLMAGATGWCGMARLLAFMPWNRRAA